MNAEHKKALIDDCKREMAELEKSLITWGEVWVPYLQSKLKRQKIALATLTAQPVKVDDSMALAFHKALSDGGVGHEDLEEIKVGLEAALCNIPRHAPAADLAEMVPPGWKLVPVEPTKQMLEASYREASVYSRTAYRAMLAAAPTPHE